jgi:hypothetical protein
MSMAYKEDRYGPQLLLTQTLAILMPASMYKPIRLALFNYISDPDQNRVEVRQDRWTSKGVAEWCVARLVLKVVITHQ